MIRPPRRPETAPAELAAVRRAYAPGQAGRPRARLLAWPLVLALALTGGGCHKKSSRVQAVVRVPYTSLVLPEEPGWVVARDVAASEQGGLVLRLMQQDAVLGAPRIEVMLEPKAGAQAAAPADGALAAFTDKNLREMAALEQAGKIKILHVAQQPSQIGTVPAWRVQHEFTLGQGNTQISLYQVSIFCVFNGRGITVTASGRTELFHPLAGSIAHILEGMTLGQDAQAGAHAAGDTTTIDLGRVGGDG